MEVWIDKDGCRLCFSDENYIEITRKLKPSSLIESLYLLRKNRNVDIYLLINYGEVTIFKMKVEKNSLEYFERIKKRILNIEHEALKKYCENLLLKYEKKIFSKLTRR